MHTVIMLVTLLFSPSTSSMDVQVQQYQSIEECADEAVRSSNEYSLQYCVVGEVQPSGITYTVE